VKDLTNLTDMQVKVLENRLRRAARRKDMSLYKTRSKIIRDYYGGYMITDLRNIVVAGRNPTAFAMHLNEVCEYFGRLLSGFGVVIFEGDGGDRRYLV
jgi:hypothetical protein